MPDHILISTAYLPPVDYFSLISQAAEVFIEANENYIKQSYRNRCYILSSHGPQLLSVPVLEGSRHKIPIKEVRIDYSKRWQQVHLRAIFSSYKCSPYFDFFYEPVEKVITGHHEFLWNLNLELLDALLKMLNIKKQIQFTAGFEAPMNESYDYRYRLEPGKNLFENVNYLQVFNNLTAFIPNLSIIDLIFNQGPDSAKYLAPA
jgi:hypothetical protein